MQQGPPMDQGNYARPPDPRQGPLAAAGAVPTLQVTPAPEPPPAPVAKADKLAKPLAAQQAALLAVKKALDPPGAMLTGWSEAAGLYCSWSNVVCDSMSNVVRLTLSYLGLEGGLPPAAVLLELPRLESLFLGGNMLKGTLPGGYSAAPVLSELYLHDNHLTGQLPAEWADSPLAANLKELSLANNGLTGQLPPQWARLSKLRVLKLNSNKLTGPVPKQWAGPAEPRMAALETLTLFGNAGLSGCLPAPLAAEGPSGAGLLQSPTGQRTRDAKQGAAGTQVTGFCTA